MTPSTRFPVFNFVVIVLIVGTAVDKSLSQESESLDTQTETSIGFQKSETENEQHPSNRVLPVDADHKSKISFPQNPLDPVCVKMLRDNLVKFLDRVKRSNQRKGRQDDGDDDGDDGDGAAAGGGLAGLFGGGGEGGNGALAALGAFPALFPQFVTTLTQTVGAVNQGLNGTDTPNLPSFLVRQAMDAVKFLVAVRGDSASSSAAAPPPHRPHIVQNIPGVTPGHKPKQPVANYEDPDYPDDLVTQPPQPELKPLSSLPGGGGNPSSGNYEAIPGSANNPFLQNADLLQNHKPKPIAGTPTELNGGVPAEKTSLWQIYKSFRNRQGVNGTLTDFQLAHPDAFSNELLQSIALSISNVRGQPSMAAPEKSAAEIFAQFYSTAKPSTLLLNANNRPTLSVYKPSASLSGVGLDLNNLALNVSANNEQEQSFFVTTTEQTDEEPSETPSPQEQNELEPAGEASPGQRVPGGSGSTAGSNLSQLTAAQQELLKQFQTIQLEKLGGGHLGGGLSSLLLATQGNNGNGNAEFVKSPTSTSHLTVSNQGYVPAVVSLHDTDDPIKVGPQSNMVDANNGFKTKTPYTPINNGILFAAPRITPSPLAYKPTPGIQINLSEPDTTPTPNFSYHFAKDKPALAPPRAPPRPEDPNAARPLPTFAAIPNRFEHFKNPLQSGLPPSLQKNEHVPESHRFAISSTTEAVEISQQEIDSTNYQSSIIQEEDKTQTITSEVPKISAPGLSNSNSLFSLYQSINAGKPQSIAMQQLLQSLYNNILKESSSPSVSDTKDSSFSSILNKGSAASSFNSPFSSSLTNKVQGNPLNLNTLFQQQSPINNLQSLGGVQQKPSQTSQLGFNPDDDEDDNVGSVPSYNNMQPDASTTETYQEEHTSALPPVTDEPSSSPYPPQAQQPAINGQPSLASFYPFQNVPQFSNPTSYNPASGPSKPPSKYPSGILNGQNPVVQNEASPVQNSGGINSFSPFPNSRFPSSQLTDSVRNQKPYGTEGRNDTANGNLDTSSEPPQTSNVNTPTNSPNLVGTFPNFESFLQFQALIKNGGANGQDKPSQQSQTPESSQEESVPSKPQIGNLPFVPSSVSQPINPENVKTPSEVITATNFAPLPLPDSNDGSPSLIQSETEPPLSFPNSFAPALPSSGLYAPPILPIDQQQYYKPTSSGVPEFQRPNQNGGYPASIPVGVPTFVGPSSIKRPVQEANYPVPPPPFSNPFQSQIAEKAPVFNKPKPAQAPNIVKGPSGSFTSKPQSHLPHAIAEMSKLPYYQEDSFRPAVIPPHISGSENNENEEDLSQERNGTNTTNKTSISDLFSSVSNVSSTNVQTIENFGAAIPETSAEHAVPNFPPGKPVYWMNMYYPNGYPVLTKVTTEATTINPRRRRRRTTTAEPRLDPDGVDGEDDDEEVDGKKDKRKKTGIGALSPS